MGWVLRCHITDIVTTFCCHHTLCVIPLSQHVTCPAITSHVHSCHLPCPQLSPPMSVTVTWLWSLCLSAVSGRPVGCAGGTELSGPGHGQEHLRHGLLPPLQHGDHLQPLPSRPPHNSGLPAGSTATRSLRFGGLHCRRWAGGEVAA